METRHTETYTLTSRREFWLEMVLPISRTLNNHPHSLGTRWKERSSRRSIWHKLVTQKSKPTQDDLSIFRASLPISTRRKLLPHLQKSIRLSVQLLDGIAMILYQQIFFEMICMKRRGAFLTCLPRISLFPSSSSSLFLSPLTRWTPSLPKSLQRIVSGTPRESDNR